MSAHVARDAVFDKTERNLGGVLSTGRINTASIIVGGVEFKSWLPKDEAECRRINTVAADIVARFHETAGSIPLIELED